MREVHENHYDTATLGRAIELLQRLHGWNGAEQSIEHGLRSLGNATSQIGNALDGLAAALDLVKIVNGTNPQEKEIA